MASSQERVTSANRSQSADGGTNNNRRQAEQEPRLPRRQRLPLPTRSTSLYRVNKLYRGPPTPPPEVQFDMEKSFVLDCKAVSNISIDYSTANPKLGSVIPPYDSRTDSHVDNYFNFFGVRRTLQGSGQLVSHESIPGRVHDRFYTRGHGFKYLSRRNQFGAGHSIDEVRGHELFLSDPKPVLNYNGVFGYRRNTPSLRHQPSIGTTAARMSEIIPFGRYSVIGCGKPYPFHCRCKFDKPCRCHNQEKLCACIKA